MDTQNSSMIDVPNLKLAKVGQSRDRKKGGGWLGANGAGSGMGGAGVGASGFMGTGMSLAKILTILLVSGGASVGAWQIGNMMAANSTVGAKRAEAPKVFADKDAKYADTSGVIKAQNTIPNSLGYINNDGLTDEQRAAKKAAEDAAASKAAADAQAQAEADAKAKALADATAASATPAPAAPVAAAPQVAKPSLAGGKFGGLSSGSGGGGLNGGSGFSGGIGSKFGGMGGLGDKGSGGNLGAFRNASAASTTKAASAAHPHFGGANKSLGQLGNANSAGRGALGSAQGESASAGNGAPFDNGSSLGTVISGPGVGAGAAAGAPDAGGSANAGGGGGGGNGGPVQSCADVNEVLDANGGCTTSTTNTTPAAAGVAPYQHLVDTCMVLLGIVAVLSILAMALQKIPVYGPIIAEVIAGIIAALGAAIALIGVSIMSMQHGSAIIGGIMGLVGGYIAYSAVSTMGNATAPGAALAPVVAHVLIATAVGELAGSASNSGMMG